MQGHARHAHLLLRRLRGAGRSTTAGSRWATWDGSTPTDTCYLGDRTADMILTGGANVYPAEVEAALLEHPGVRSAVVIGLPDEDKGNAIHAIVEADEEHGTGGTSCSEFAAERLVVYKLPRSVEYVDEPLRDDAGKVRRSALSGSTPQRRPDGTRLASRRELSYRRAVVSRVWAKGPVHHDDRLTTGTTAGRPRHVVRRRTFRARRREERTDVALEVSGSLPVDLNGRYLRIGPNPIHPDPRPAPASPATDGARHQLEDGRAVWYRNRWVRTPDVVAGARRRRTAPARRAGERSGRREHECGAHRWADVGTRRGRIVPRRAHDELGTRAQAPTSTARSPARSPPTRSSIPRTGRWHAITYHWHEEAVHHVVVGATGEVERDVVVALNGSPDGP